MTFEHAPVRRRSFYAAIPQIGVPAGLLLANTAFLAVIGVNESPEFELAKSKKEPVRNSIGAVLHRDGKSVLQAIRLRLAETVGSYVVVTFLLTYLVQKDIATKEIVLFGIVLALIIGLVSHPIYGALSDKFVRKPVYILGSTFVILLAFSLVLLINTGNAVVLIAAMMLALVIAHDSLTGVQSAWLQEFFHASKRMSGASPGYPECRCDSRIRSLYRDWPMGSMAVGVGQCAGRDRRADFLDRGSNTLEIAPVKAERPNLVAAR